MLQIALLSVVGYRVYPVYSPFVPMRRKRIVISSLLLLLLIGGCVLGTIGTAQPDAERFLMPGALDVRVTDVGIGRRLITYRMANPDDGWLARVTRRLKDEGWSAPTEYYEWGSTEKYSNTYTRRIEFWRLRIWERAYLDGNARLAHITVQRWVEWR
jgi:hypothetical protein